MEAKKRCALRTSGINTSVRELLEFASDTVTKNLITASRRNMIDVSENDLRKVKAIVETSIEETIVNGYANVEKAIGKFVNESQTKPKRRKK